MSVVTPALPAPEPAANRIGVSSFLMTGTEPDDEKEEIQ